MDKKQLRESYFENSEVPKLPKTGNKGNQNKAFNDAAEPKIYSKHKIYDSPDVPKADELATGRESSTYSDEEILEISPNLVYVPSYKVDRKRMTDESLRTFAENIATVGQAQPCMVRLRENKDGQKYELIFGERRYRAALLKNLPLKVVVKEKTDTEAALLLLSENYEREDNADCDLGEQLSELIDSERLKQTDIVKKTGIPRQRVSKLLCFRRIPKQIKEAIGDCSKVSATTAEAIVNLTDEDENNIGIILNIVDKIASGNFGHTKIKAHIKNFSRPREESKLLQNKKIYSNTGRHLFTWRLDNNKVPSIHFPKDILKLVDTGQVDADELTTEIAGVLESKLHLK